MNFIIHTFRMQAKLSAAPLWENDPHVQCSSFCRTDKQKEAGKDIQSQSPKPHWEGAIMIKTLIICMCMGIAFLDYCCCRAAALSERNFERFNRITFTQEKKYRQQPNLK